MIKAVPMQVNKKYPVERLYKNYKKTNTFIHR
jgi:hypothetical protein